MKGDESDEPVGIFFDPLGMPIVVEDAGVWVFPVPTEKDRLVHTGVLHIRKHLPSVGPTLKSRSLFRLHQAQPVKFLCLVCVGFRIPDDVVGIPVCVCVYDHCW